MKKHLFNVCNLKYLRSRYALLMNRNAVREQSTTPIELNKVEKGLIDKIAKENGFKQYEITTSKGTDMGDNFLGIITQVTVDNGKNKLDLILKSAHQTETFRKAAPIHQAYLREIYMYENILEEFRKFQNVHNVDNAFNSFAKFYGASKVEENECLIMEDLNVQGYQLWNKHFTMNPEHMSLIFKEYAKFHAISMAMKHNNPELYEKITKDIKKTIWEEKEGEDKFGEHIKSVFAVGYDVVKDSSELTKFLKEVETVLPEIFHIELKKPEYQQAIVHGDSWCNNIMFKYDNENDKSVPSNLRIIDWQMSFENSPAYDFCYFFLVNSSKAALDDYQTYLKIYYEAFSKHLRSFNCDPDEIFPYSRFEQHINVYMVYEMYISFILLRTMLSDSTEAPNLSELTEDQYFFDKLHFKINKSDLFESRLRTIISFIKEQNFLNKLKF